MGGVVGDDRLVSGELQHQVVPKERTSTEKQLHPSNQSKGVLGSDCRGKQRSRFAQSSSPQTDLAKHELGSADEGGLEAGGAVSPGDHAVEQVGEAAIARRNQKFLENAEKKRFEVHPVSPQLRRFSRSNWGLRASYAAFEGGFWLSVVPQGPADLNHPRGPHFGRFGCAGRCYY